MSPDLLRIDPDTHVLRTLPGGAGLLEASLVVGGAEPVVATGRPGAGAGDRAWWDVLDAALAGVPVRWLVVTHEAPGQAAGVVEALRRWPEATLVASGGLADRLVAATPLPEDRVRWVAEGDEVRAGDRALTVVRPPASWAPSARGLYEADSGLYWAADCFGCPVPHPVEEVSQLDRDVWEDGFTAYHLALAPWLADVDPARWRAAVARVAVLAPRTIGSAHGPLVRRGDVGRALDLLADLAGLPAVVDPAPSAAGARRMAGAQ